MSWLIIFQLVNIRDYPYPLKSFAEARNYFLERLRDNEYVLFVEEDEEVPEMLLEYIRHLKPEYPYYNVRRVNLYNYRNIPLWNPFYCGKLCSNRIRFVGSIHEVPRPEKPCGWIDIPTIHNQMPSDKAYPSTIKSPEWFKTRLYRLLLVILKLRDILRGW